MSTHNKHCHDKIMRFLSSIPNILFSEEFSWDSKNELESTTINKPSLFESSKLTAYAIAINRFPEPAYQI